MSRALVRVAAVAGAGCALAAAAQGGTRDVHRRQLALMPLPRPALGAAARSLLLDPDSGLQSNGAAARRANGNITAATLDHVGRLIGYALEYGDGAGRASTARHGLLGVRTAADLYLSPAAARAGLALWRRDAAALGPRTTRGRRASTSFFPTGRPGGGGFGASAVVELPGRPPVYEVEVQFVHGPLVGSVEVSAEDRHGRSAFALALARRLEARMAGVLRGRITGPPVPLPARPAPRVNLRMLALLPLDLGDGVVTQEGYVRRKKGSSVSEYLRVMSPAGAFVYLQEKIALFHTTTQASYTYSLLGKALSSAKALGRYDPSARVTSYRPTPVPVKGGDEVRAARALATIKGAGPVIEAVVVMRVDRTTELIVARSPATVPLTEAAIQGLVSVAARRARVGLQG